MYVLLYKIGLSDIRKILFFRHLLMLFSLFDNLMNTIVFINVDEVYYHNPEIKKLFFRSTLTTITNNHKNSFEIMLIYIQLNI